MQARSISFHLAIAFLLLAASSILVLAFPLSFPHPEDFSPSVYLCAFVLGCIALISNRRHFWLHLAIPAIALFGFLEEISYGAEDGVLHSNYLYWETYNLKIRDVHNLLPTVFRVIRQALGTRQWNSDFFFSEFFYFMVALLGVVFIFIVGLRQIGTRSKPALKPAILRLFAGLSAILPPLLIARLLAMPVDPKNILLWGLSSFRLGAVILLIAVEGLLIWVLLRSRDSENRKGLQAHIDADLAGKGQLLQAVCWLLFGLGLLFQFGAPLGRFADQLPLLQRVSPLMVWATQQAALLGLALSAWQGRFPHPAASWPNPMRRLQAFLLRHPAYVYVFFGVAIVLLAQVIDRGWITLNPYINLPNFWVSNWELLIEETLEMVGGLQLAAAAVLVWQQPQKAGPKPRADL